MANTSFTAGGRRRRLCRRKHGGPWQIRFQVKGKPVWRSLGATTDDDNGVRIAKERARQIIEAEINGDVETSRKMKVKTDYSLLSEVVEIFIAKYGTDARRRGTALGYTNALARIVKTVWFLSIDKVRTSILTGELIRKYETEKEKLIDRDGNGFTQESEARVRASILGEVGNARSIFAKGIMNWYESLSLPDLTSFRDQRVKRPERGHPRKLDDGVMEAINAAAPELARTNPPCYIAHLLFKLLGMRNSEIRAARMSWIQRNLQGVPVLHIIYRPEEGFKPKRKTERHLALAPAVLAEIQKYWTPSPDGDFIVTARHKSGRYDIVDREHNAWAGQWIKGRTKVWYELRRYAGSLVYKKTKNVDDPLGNLRAVQKFLGHSDFQTTLEWYLCDSGDAPALDLSDFAPATGENVIAFGK